MSEARTSIPLPDLWTPAVKRLPSAPAVITEPLEPIQKPVLSPSKEPEAQSPAYTIPEAPEAAQQPVEAPVLGKTAKDFDKPVKIVDINCVDLQKHLVRILIVDDNREYDMSNEAKVLAVQLATLWDNKEHTGVICPPVSRLLAWNDWTEAELRSYTLELAVHGLFRVKSDSRGGISIYVPLFLEEALRMKEETAKVIKGTTDHYIHAARYSGLSSTARVISLYLTAKSRAKWNQLGYIFGQHKTGYKVDNARSLRATFFDHPIMDAKTPEEIKFLAELDELWPDEVMSGVRKTRVPLADILRISGSPEEWNEAKVELAANRYWDHEAQGNGLLFTPLMGLHQRVWDLNMIAGGNLRNTYEIVNGFFPIEDTDPEGDDPYLHRPPLGYHWLYILKFGSLRQVGESTQPLRRRAQQHCQSPTNAFAEKHITAALRQGSVPEIEFAGIVHKFKAAEEEMALLHRVREQQQNVSNAITEVSQNRGTIKQDRRFEGMSYQEVKQILHETQNPEHPAAQLARRLNASLGVLT